MDKRKTIKCSFQITLKAWNSPKREKEKKGRRFKLDDCRMWMRLIFWSCRIEKIDKKNRRNQIKELVYFSYQMFDKSNMRLQTNENYRVYVSCSPTVR